jgi:hypothetical protein
LSDAAASILKSRETRNSVPRAAMPDLTDAPSRKRTNPGIVARS